eukprot:scaffold39002_cov150-Skeletonema_dohrnii-CCMP3373.AAC.2
MERNSPCTAAESPNAQAMKGCSFVLSVVVASIQMQGRCSLHETNLSCRHVPPARYVSFRCSFGARYPLLVTSSVESIVNVYGTHLNRRSDTAASKCQMSEGAYY